MEESSGTTATRIPVFNVMVSGGSTTPSSCKGKTYIFSDKQNQDKEAENPKRKHADTNPKENLDRVLKLKRVLKPLL